MSAIVAVLVMVVFIVAVTTRQWRIKERAFAWAALVQHGIFSTLVYRVTVATSAPSDTRSYLRAGRSIAQYLRFGGTSAWEDVLRLIVQYGAPIIPVPVYGIGTPTGSMYGSAGIAMYVFESMFFSSFTFALFGFLGQLAYAASARKHFDSHLRLPVLAAIFFLPSFHFWSGGFFKETFAIAGVGWLVLGLSRISFNEGSRWFSIAMSGSGLYIIALSKPFLLFPLAIATGAYFAIARSQRSGRTILLRHVFVGVAFAAIVITLLGIFFPSYAIANLEETIAHNQRVGAIVGGGSYINQAGLAEQTLGSRYFLLPISLITVFLRPFIFEAHNLNSVLNAAETTLVLFLLVFVQFRVKPQQMLREIVTSPALAFTATFALISSIGVGLTTTNLGTLSRYRAPFYPLIVVTFLCIALNAQKRHRERKMQTSKRPPNRSLIVPRIGR